MLKNPFKTLCRTVDLCGWLRIAMALGTGIYFENILPALVAFIFISALTDFFILRPLFKKTFVGTPFSDEDIAWLATKQDITPENLMVFFRKILCVRAVSLTLALVSIPLVWMVKGQFLALEVAPFVYVAAFFFMFASFQHKALSVFPKKYRPSPNTRERTLHVSNEPYDFSRNAIRHWDQTDSRSIAYRLHHWDYGAS